MTHKPTHTIEELTTWLPTFQAELRADIHTSDGTRRPSYYTFRYMDIITGSNAEYYDEYVLLNADEPYDYYTPRQAAKALIDNDYDLAHKLAEHNEAGLSIINGEPMLADVEEFIDWANTPEIDQWQGWSITGAQTVPNFERSYIFLTRQSAQRELDRAPWRHHNTARAWSDSLHNCPDIERLCELIYALDLENSTLVFTQENAR